jgi:GT2 family glycosyltransferase
LTPEVSVIVPVRDGASSLPALLDSLEAQQLDNDRYEVIIVDNASRDGTAEIAAARDVRVVDEPTPNRSGARNAGARAARADLFAFVDADCRATPQWLRELLRCRGRAPLVAGKVELETRPEPNAIERFESRWRFNQVAAVAHGWAATANLLCERAAFESIGGFDSAYSQNGEDVDFGVRAGRAGFPISYCSQAVVRHDAEWELRPVIRRAFFHGYGAVQLLRRLGMGHIAWRHPRAIISPRTALSFHAIDPASLPRGDRITYAALAMLNYASRVTGSAWASLARVR